jgi:hypothetical protein
MTNVVRAAYRGSGRFEIRLRNETSQSTSAFDLVAQRFMRVCLTLQRAIRQAVNDFSAPYSYVSFSNIADHDIYRWQAMARVRGKGRNVHSISPLTTHWDL